MSDNTVPAGAQPDDAPDDRLVDVPSDEQTPVEHAPLADAPVDASAADAPADEEPETDAAGADVPDGDPYERRDDGAFVSVADGLAAATAGPEAVDASAPPQYGVGPFSIREVSLGGVWLLAFVVSFFPVYTYGPAGVGPNVWIGIDWVLKIGLPTVAVFLLVLRRLSPQGIRRVGSLSIDQFASVAFAVATVAWFEVLWTSFATASNAGFFMASWVAWAEFLLMFAGVFLTVFAPLFPTIGDDFRHRPEVPAHRVASPARPVVARPAPTPAPHDAASPYAPTAAPHAEAAAPFASAPAPVADDVAVPSAGESDASPVGAGAVPEQTTGTAGAAAAAAAVAPAAEQPQEQAAISVPPASQAFWALAPEERTVIDGQGAPLFTIGPTAWALVIEDRGDTFVVRHEDGRIGYLLDVAGITRG